EKLKIASAAQNLGVAAYIPPGGVRVYYVLLASMPNGDMHVVAVIPQRMSASKFITLHDEWRDKLDSVINDPEFKGIMM
ncbi:MAG: hypothetical protein ACHQ9S_19065, partial [Candidatus Binatia bacterium]